MSDITKQLGLRIRYLRNERHMSQEEVAFKAGITASHLGQIERVTRNPTVDTVAGISAALNVPITTLFEEITIAPSPNSATPDKINAYLQAMTESEQADILRIIRIFRSRLPQDKKKGYTSQKLTFGEVVFIQRGPNQGLL